jgi:acetyl esterase/lipase
MKPTSTSIHSSGRLSGMFRIGHGASMLLWLASLCPAQDSRPDLFTRLDTNKDGKVVVEELPDRQKENFKRIDANSDGAISRDELVKHTSGNRGPKSGSQARTAIEPTHADVAYGPHERNKMDLYLVESKTPTPLVLYIHGGGFQGGDKRPAGSVREYHAAGWSVAAINYWLTNVLPAPGQYLDCARAIQFIRHNAEKWNINPKLIASTGGSAGAGTSLWLAFHDDLADPKSDDPIARQSTRLVCVAVSNGQSSYDPRFAEKVGIPRPNFERHGFFRPFYNLEPSEFDTPKAYARYEEAAPITYLTKDDPPAMLTYTYANEDVTPTSDLGLVVHHPKLGIGLKEQMDKLGVECVVQYRSSKPGETIRHGGGETVSPVGFIRKHFEAAAK